MAADDVPLTIYIPAEMIDRLDAFAVSTERTRTYWMRQALEELIERELRQLQEVEEALAADEADPEEGLGGAQFERWLIELGLTTPEALAQAAAWSLP